MRSTRMFGHFPRRHRRWQRGALIGSLALARFAVPALALEPAVELPPVLVEARSGAPHWRYLRTPEYEILSRCDDASTRTVAETQHRMHQLLAYVLPPSLQASPVLPRIMILYDDSALPQSARDALARLNAINDSNALLKLPTPSADTPVRFLANPSLYDAERVAVFVRVPAASAEPDRGPSLDFGDAGMASSRPSAPPVSTGWTMLTTGYVSYLINERRPPLPDWFRSGFLGMYHHATFRDRDVMLDPFAWTSNAATQLLRAGHDADLSLLPLQSVFADSQPPPEEIARWVAEAELFVRWGVEPANRRAFARWVERCALEPANEAAFRASFGFGYARAEEELRRFAHSAARQSTLIDGPALGSLPKVPLRNATRAEIATLKGDAERLEASYVRATQPEIADAYLNEARHTLHQAYDKGERGAELLGVMGLCEVEGGRPDRAKPYFEAAIAAGCDRPRVLVELARMSIEQARAAVPASADVAARARDRALQWLRAAAVRIPPIPECYELLASLLSEREQPLEEGDRRLLESAASIFRSNFEVVSACASTLAQRGDAAVARRLAESALRLGATGEVAERLRQLAAETAPRN